MDKKAFPFKTLIWAVVAIAALFLFKPEIASLLKNSQEVNVFGINIKVSEKQSEELLVAQKKFEEQAAHLNQKIEQQETAMDSLNILTANLTGQIQGCQSAQSTAIKIDSSLRKLNILNQNIKREPFLMQDYQVVKKISSR